MFPALCQGGRRPQFPGMRMIGGLIIYVLVSNVCEEYLDRILEIFFTRNLERGRWPRQR